MCPSLSTIPFCTDHSSLSRLWRILDFGACRCCRMVRTLSSSCWQSWIHCWNCVSTISVVSCFLKRESVRGHNPHCCGHLLHDLVALRGHQISLHFARCMGNLKVESGKI